MIRWSLTPCVELQVLSSVGQFLAGLYCGEADSRVGQSSQVLVRDADWREVVRPLDVLGRCVNGLAFLPDGNTLATRSKDGVTL